MSLPTGFESSQDYFEKVISFLQRYSWIYQEANTCFIKSNILENMPKEFQNYFQEIGEDELNSFPHVHQPMPYAVHQLPASLKNFRQNLACLIPTQAYDEPPPLEQEIHMKKENFKKMNMKKRHEIQRLANKVKQQLNRAMEDEEAQVDGQQPCVLIDFGCGLGYLSESLYKLNENFLILGLESDQYRVEAAVKRLHEYMPQAEPVIHYRQAYITENSRAFIEECCRELLQSNYCDTMTPLPLDPILCQRMAIIGLHACADLTITSMRLFLSMPSVRHLTIMPCCYHKMQMCTDNSQKFLNFPLSHSLREVVLSAEHDNALDNYVTYLNRPFLRLACQQTMKRWQKCSKKQHAVHGREMFLRAVAEALRRKETEVVVKSKEKFDLSWEDEMDFEMFQRLYHLQTKEDGMSVEWSQDQRTAFNALLEKYPNGDKLAEGLTCLQTAMQKLCENLVLYDRLCYMQEMADQMKLSLNVRYEKLMDEELSPRCYVLIAEKL